MKQFDEIIFDGKKQSFLVEIQNLDVITGGFNLQNTWNCGCIAVKTITGK